MVEQEALRVLCRRFEPYSSCLIREGTRIGISACLRASGDPVNSRFGSRGVSSTPFPTKIAA